MSDTPEIAIEPPAPRRSRGRIVAGFVAVVAIIGGVAFAAASLGDSGSNSPEDPVRAMFAAAQQGDVLGVMAELDPGERDALRGPLSDLVTELNRLDVLKDAHLDHLTGVQLQVEGLELSSDAVDSGLAHVRINKGSSSYAVDPDKLPLGGFVRDLAGDGLKDARSSDRGDLTSKQKDDFVTTVRRGGRWYVSIGYSVAEIARLDAGKSRADLGAGVPAKGTDSPEAAVRDLITAATKLDVRRLVELLPPDELGAVHDYAALFLGAAERGAQDANKDVSITMPTLELDSSTSGDHATVRIRKLAIAARLGDASFAYRDGCIDVTPPATTNDTGRPQHVCDLRDTTELLRSFGVTGGSKPPTLSFANKKADIGIIATRVDGKWYVSPTRTSLVALVDTLRMFRPSDLTTIRDDVKQVLQGFTGSAGDPTSPDGSVGGVLRSGPATTAGA